jgi:hypothetical protein
LCLFGREDEHRPAIDTEKSRSSLKWLRQQQFRTCYRAHVYGQSYDTRYKLHPFSGYELASLRAVPSWSIGKRGPSSWLEPANDVPGPGQVAAAAAALVDCSE